MVVSSNNKIQKQRLMRLKGGENVKILNCVRCGHSWFARKSTLPRNCARCKILYWYKPARIPKYYGEPRPVGRPYKYPVDSLEVGQTKIIPHNFLPDGHNVNNRGIYISIGRYSKKTGRKFDFKSMLHDLLVTRWK